MPFIPHTDDDVRTMLRSIGVDSIDDLFTEIPKALRIAELSEIPDGFTESEMRRQMEERSIQDAYALNFIGAGAYEHHIPAAVWDIVSRGEWMTAYTPYQAEASQGTLQLLYEYQTMMARLLAMDVSNASLYDGASALAEAVLMAVRCHPNAKTPRILMPCTVHPYYRQVVKTIVQAQSIEIVECPYSPEQGIIQTETLEEFAHSEITAVVISQPNFFGLLEDVDGMTDFAHRYQALTIGVVNPIAMALLKPPGEWGKFGADIVCGEGQPLGIPLVSGGPYFGFLSCKREHIRQLPGRLIGRTTDQIGREGFTLTLQAREQHIRRAKATSNICTNQGLLVTAATIYLSLLGSEGLYRAALQCHAQARFLREQLSHIEGVSCLFPKTPFFHEIVLRFKSSLDPIIKAFTQQGIEPGFDLRRAYPELGECLLVCATETKTEEDLKRFVSVLNVALHSEVSIVNL